MGQLRRRGLRLAPRPRQPLPADRGRRVDPRPPRPGRLVELRAERRSDQGRPRAGGRPRQHRHPSPAPSDDSSDPWGGGLDGSGSAGSGSDGSDASGAHDEPGDEPGDGPSDPAPSPDASDSTGSGKASTGPEPSAPATPDDRDDAPSRSADPSDGGSRTDTTGTPHEAPAQGKHRGGTDGEGADDGGRSSGGRHASRGDDARTDPPAGGHYTVRPGDTLSAIAAAHRLPGGWGALYDHNEGVIGSDADLIKPGQQLDLGHTAG